MFSSVFLLRRLGRTKNIFLIFLKILKIWFESVRNHIKSIRFWRFGAKRSEHLDSTQNFGLDSVVQNDFGLIFDGFMAGFRQKCKQFWGRHVHSHVVHSHYLFRLFILAIYSWSRQQSQTFFWKMPETMPKDAAWCADHFSYWMTS